LLVTFSSFILTDNFKLTVKKIQKYKKKIKKIISLISFVDAFVLLPLFRLNYRCLLSSCYLP